MAGIKDVIKTLDDASEVFDKVVTKSQMKIYAEAFTLMKGLEVDGQGKVKQTIANLKLLVSIKSKLAAVSNNKEYLAGVGKFLQYFDALQKEQNAYFSANFPQATIGEQAKKRHEAMKQIAVQNVIDALTGDGLKANVTDKVNDILLRAVTTGAKFSNLQEELRAHLIGVDGGTGALSRYATTYATTAISQFTGQNNKLLTQDLGVKWFMYTGSTKETTREFCEHLVKKRYIHRSEFHKILQGDIDGHQCGIYAKTGLPFGMIEGTNEDNFQVNCGGWNCRHQLVPVSELAVPAELREKFKEEPIVLPYTDDQQQKVDLLNKYINEHPGSQKMIDYLSAIESLKSNGDAEEMSILIDAVVKEVNKQNASYAAKKKKKDAQKAEKEFNEKLAPLTGSIDDINKYVSEHPKSGKVANYLKDINELLIIKNPGDLPQIEAIVEMAKKTIDKNEKDKQYKAEKIKAKHDAVLGGKVSASASDAQKQAIKNIVDATIDKWLAKWGYQDWDSAPLSHKIGKLEYEITQLTQKKNYDTWRISAGIYDEMLQEAKAEEEQIKAKTKLGELKQYQSKYKKYAKLLDDAEAFITNGDYDKAIEKLNQAEYIKLGEEQKEADKIAEKAAKEAEKAAKKAAKEAAKNIKNSGNKFGIVPPESTNDTKQTEHIPGSYNVKTHVYNLQDKSVLAPALDEIKKATGVKTDEEAIKFYDAVDCFSFQWDYEIRQVECGNDFDENRNGHKISDAVEKAKNLELFIAMSPKWDGGVVYRGMSLSDEEVNKMRETLKKGEQSMLGTASWSTEESKSQFFAEYHIGDLDANGNVKNNKVMLRCTNQKNATSIRYLSYFYEENEVITSMKNRYSFINETKQGEYIYFDVSCS